MSPRRFRKTGEHSNSTWVTDDSTTSTIPSLCWCIFVFTCINDVNHMSWVKGPEKLIWQTGQLNLWHLPIQFRWERSRDLIPSFSGNLWVNTLGEDIYRCPSRKINHAVGLWFDYIHGLRHKDSSTMMLCGLNIEYDFNLTYRSRSILEDLFPCSIVFPVTKYTSDFLSDLWSNMEIGGELR